MNSAMKIGGMIILAVLVFAAGKFYAEKNMGGSAPMETALEHSAKHMDSKYQCPMHPNIVKDKDGSCPICGMGLELIENPSASSKPKEKKIIYWVAPMDPNYRRDKPGKSPMGMDLVPVYDEGDDESSDTGIIVKISPTVINNMGVRVADVKKGKLWRKVDTVGYVGLDESRVSHIHLRVDGWIENLAVKIEGDRVKKGQRLFDLYSPTLVNAMEEYVQSLKSGSSRLTSASIEKMLSLGVSQKQIDELTDNRKVPRVIKFYAPQRGMVSMLNVREGMYVKPSKQVMSLADLSSIWVLAEVFENQSQWLKLGHAADVTLSFLPGRVWEGKVDYIYPSLDAKNRTLRVRMRFNNRDEALKPNMYANVSIYGTAKKNVISVPREALIKTGQNERLIVAKGKGRFEQRLVVAGIESGDWVEIMSGIDAGERVVVSSQFLIDSEASMKASLLRMSEPKVENETAAPGDKK